MLGSFRVAAQLAASREGLGSMSDRDNFIFYIFLSAGYENILYFKEKRRNMRMSYVNELLEM
jgi:hypothetical protein